MMKYAAGQRALDVGETACECESAYVNMGMLSVCVSLYTTVLSLSLQLLMPNPRGYHSGFELGLFCRETEQPNRETPSVKIHNSFVRDTSTYVCPEYVCDNSKT